MRKHPRMTPPLIPKPWKYHQNGSKKRPKNIQERSNGDAGHRSAPRTVKASTKRWFFGALLAPIQGLWGNFGTHRAPSAPENLYFGAKMHQKLWKSYLRKGCEKQLNFGWILDGFREGLGSQNVEFMLVFPIDLGFQPFSNKLEQLMENCDQNDPKVMPQSALGYSAGSIFVIFLCFEMGVQKSKLEFGTRRPKCTSRAENCVKGARATNPGTLRHSTRPACPRTLGEALFKYINR